MLSLQELVDQRRKRIAAGQPSGTPTTMIAPAQMHLDATMVKALGEMDDKQRENVVSAVMGMYTPQMAAQAGGQNALAFMWPILANYARQNPGTSSGEMMSMAKSMNDALIAGAEYSTL